MTYWVFATEAEANVAQAVCAAALPQNTVDGRPAPVQITTAWALVEPTTDGRFGFVACPLVVQLAEATDLTDDEWSVLQPPPITTNPMGSA